MDLSIREATLDDRKILAVLYEYAMPVTHQNYVVTDESILKREKLIEELMTKRKDPIFYLAEHEGKPLGFICAIGIVDPEVKTKMMWIYQLYVEPEYREHGVAKELKQKVEQWAIDHDYDQVASDIAASNKRMIKINEGMGYHIEWVIMQKDLPKKGE